MIEKTKQLLRKRFALPKASFFEEAVSGFTATERVIFGVAGFLLLFSTVFLLSRINDLFLVEIPAHGGTLSEGIIGTPRFVNPLLSLSDADRDLSALIYSGLLKATPEGTLVPDLAESYSISPNGLTYSFILKENLRFHDGAPITADDVIFTIQKTEDSGLKSPKRANWEGVSAEKISEREVRLTLKQPYSPFLENATLGILPKHIWKDADAEQFPFSPFNVHAVGSGPYKVMNIKLNSSGIPLYYELRSFKDYALGEPFIKNLVVRFYSGEKQLLDAYHRKEIESTSGIPPATASRLSKTDVRIESTPLPRIFGVFFNQNQAPILADSSIRKALELATDKETLVKKVLFGYGLPIDSPIPPLLLSAGTSANASQTMEERLDAAKKILDKAGWKENPEGGVREFTKKKVAQELSFSLATSNAPELKETAELLKSMWEALGAKVELKTFDVGDLNQNVIRPRKYDALLFGEIIGRDLDLFAFWHSSQRNDPGLNIAMYANSKVDKLLDDGRKLLSDSDRLTLYRTVDEEIQKDIPAIFTYSPDFIYVLPEKVRGFTLDRLTIPSERFLDIEHWYTRTEKVWEVFTKYHITE